MRAPLAYFVFLVLSACGNKAALIFPRNEIRSRIANPRRASEFFFVPGGTLCADACFVEIGSASAPELRLFAAALELAYREFDQACSGRESSSAIRSRPTPISRY